MMRKKMRHAVVEKETKRKCVFGQRKANLFKKAEELSILCDIDMAMVIVEREENELVACWPSPEAVTGRFIRLLNTCEADRARKMVTQEKYLQDQVKSLSEYVSHKEQINAEKEARLVVKQLTRGKKLCDLGVPDLEILCSFASSKLLAIKKQFETCGGGTGGGGHEQNQNQFLQAAAAETDTPPPTGDFLEATSNNNQEPTLMMENLIRNHWAAYAFPNNAQDH